MLKLSINLRFLEIILQKIEKEKIICDVDTGIDDAVAIGLAVKDENLDLKLITTCAGNNSVENVTNNTLDILNWFKSSVPVAQGAKKHLKRERQKLAVHGGPTGIGNYPFEKSKQKKCKEDAVDKMYQVIKEQKPISIVCTAPLTNIALLFMKHPDVVKDIKVVVIESGLLIDENYKSFNVTSDPEAMEIVINSGVPILICPSDMGHITCLSEENVRMLAKQNKTGEMFATIFKSFRDRICQDRVAMHDSCAVACLSRPDLFVIEPARCSIEKNGEEAKFKIQFGVEPNCDCCTHIDVEGFKAYLFNLLSKCE